jgi:hypothetical protein
MIPDPKESTVKKENEWAYREGEIELGRKLDNPYSIENMTKAYNNLVERNNKAGKVAAGNQVVKVSHLYIRWLPKSWAEYDELKNDKTLLLYDIPLDYEVVVNGNKYHDKSVPADLPTWQYTVIEKDYKFNKKIKYEILAEAYIPEKDKDLKNKNGRLPAGFSVDELINEALTITDNKDYLIPLENKKAKVAWTPAGRVTVRDTRLNALIGVQGVYVRARRFLSIESGVADANGNYIAGGSFGGGANYALYWEAPDFDVRSGALGQAWVNGPFLSSNWNVNFEDGVDRFYAHVFRGAWRYHYGNIDGLCRPGRIPWFGIQPLISTPIKYAALNSVGDAQGSNLGNWTVFGINPNINVWRLSDDGEYESDEIFSTTIHETAHSTHIRVVNLYNFTNASVAMRESWAVGVEWLITGMEYRERGILNYGTQTYFNLTNRTDIFQNRFASSFPLNFAYQYWPFSTSNTLFSNAEYTPIYIDLTDDFNQNNTIFLGNGPPPVNDDVTGYSLRVIETSFLRNVRWYTNSLQFFA